MSRNPPPAKRPCLEQTPTSVKSSCDNEAQAQKPSGRSIQDFDLIPDFPWGPCLANYDERIPPQNKQAETEMKVFLDTSSPESNDMMEPAELVCFGSVITHFLTFPDYDVKFK